MLNRMPAGDLQMNIHVMLTSGETVYSMPAAAEDKPRESVEHRAAKRQAREAERDPEEPWALQVNRPAATLAILKP